MTTMRSNSIMLVGLGAVLLVAAPRRGTKSIFRVMAMPIRLRAGSSVTQRMGNDARV